MTSRPTFATFWAGGALSPFEQACLHSFVVRGYPVVLYSYDTIQRVPSGITLADARRVIDERYASAYLIKGKPSLSHFSDIFRYKLFEKTDDIWIDSDIVLLRSLDIDLPKTLLAKEHESSLCGAIMRLDRTDPQLAVLMERCEALAGRNLVWGETGPRLLTSVFGHDQLFRAAFEPAQFFPIHYDDFWKVFLPEYFDECQSLCKQAYTLHLWNNLVVKLGIWKEFMPPAGSYLHEQFVSDSSDRYFQGTYPAEVMRMMVENWRHRYSGADLGLGPLTRQLIPGIQITARDRIQSLIAKIPRGSRH